ncbi:MAG: cytochrome c oxidase subunit II [Alphaproteobacteria bacterium GM7ARS4]|nr:cytochrome c oxidase subunit II [Alphaproteobacteria bacterium GM7ARS4]
MVGRTMGAGEGGADSGDEIGRGRCRYRRVWGGMAGYHVRFMDMPIRFLQKITSFIVPCLSVWVLSCLYGLYAGERAYAASPQPWQIGSQPAASPQMAEISALHEQVLWIIFAIAIFVAVLMVYVMIRFRVREGHTQGTATTHNSFLEVVWTVIPIMILVAMAIPSFKLLYAIDKAPHADMTIKVTGETWYWTYAYPDHGDLTFEALMKEEEELGEGEPRLLATDYNVTVPVGKTVRLLVTSNPHGVIHSWSVPSLGVKMDAVPGRLHETWFRIDEEGIYYGQCAELCGVRHGYMPIAVEAVSEERFQEWLQEMQEEWSDRNDGDGHHIASVAMPSTHGRHNKDALVSE